MNKTRILMFLLFVSSGVAIIIATNEKGERTEGNIGFGRNNLHGDSSREDVSGDSVIPYTNKADISVE